MSIVGAKLHQDLNVQCPDGGSGNRHRLLTQLEETYWKRKDSLRPQLPHKVPRTMRVWAHSMQYHVKWYLRVVAQQAGKPLGFIPPSCVDCHHQPQRHRCLTYVKRHLTTCYQILMSKSSHHNVAPEEESEKTWMRRYDGKHTLIKGISV